MLSANPGCQMPNAEADDDGECRCRMLMLRAVADEC